MRQVAGKRYAALERDAADAARGAAARVASLEAELSRVREDAAAHLDAASRRSILLEREVADTVHTAGARIRELEVRFHLFH